MSGIVAVTEEHHSCATIAWILLHPGLQKSEIS
jgi:hypothetical protein